jgi:alkylation response protein AidB-like acyl-CoA dehydrogenase
VSIAVSSEQRAIQESIRQWAARAGVLATVRALEPGLPGAAARPWARHWRELADLGIFSMGVPESAGGSGGSVADLAAALEQVTDALVPGPVTPTLLAGLVLAGHADSAPAKEILPAITRGEASVAVALGSGPVLGAGTTTHLLLPLGEAWILLDAEHPGLTTVDRTPLDFSRALADVEFDGVVVPAERVLVPDRFSDTAALLYSVEAVAVAAWCLRTASQYAKVRRQFGRPIGSFQAIKHLCAGMLCRAERAAATVWDAACAYDSAPDEFPLAVAAAAAIAFDAAVDNAKDCIQVLGGIGFTWEHDVHLYLRRAVALRALLGGAPVWRARVAALAISGRRRSTYAGPDGDEAARGRIEAIGALPVERQRAALADAGLLTPEWPPPYGLDAPPARQLAIDAELNRAGLTRPDLGVGAWALPTILRYGTPEQRNRFIGPTLRGEITWCQLFSEPEAGSDLASVRTRAVPVGDGWRLSGQKVWTSLAASADWGICLARTDPDAPRHRGLTYFLVPMRSTGIEIRPLRELTGRAVFNEVFLDGVVVPDDCVVGEPGQGWRLARGTLAFERVAIGRGSTLGDEVERLIEAVRVATVAGPLGRDAAEPDRSDLLGALVADGLAISALDRRRTRRTLDGQQDPAGAAVAKLVGVGHRQAVAEAGLLLLGTQGSTVDGAAAGPVHQFLLTRCLSIAGGTTQILLTLVAERVLGLPREEG